MVLKLCHIFFLVVQCFRGELYTHNDDNIFLNGSLSVFTAYKYCSKIL